MIYIQEAKNRISISFPPMILTICDGDDSPILTMNAVEYVFTLGYNDKDH